MKVFLISYHIKKTGRDLTALNRAFATFSNSYNCLDNTWLVRSEESANDIFARIKPLFLDDDLVLIIEVGKHYWGWLPAKAWEWMAENIQEIKL